MATAEGNYEATAEAATATDGPEVEAEAESGSGSGSESMEAQRFIDVALREMNAGNYEQAVRLLNKAKSLYPDSQAEELQELIAKLRAHSEARARSSADGARQRRTPSSASATASTSSSSSSAAGPGASHSTPAGPEYTREQLELVKRLNKCTNFYQVLGVTRDATDSDVKRAYKKLALQLHPDKNRAPGAAEAFKTVGNAVAVLTDEQRRKDYDASGADSLSPNGSTASFHAKNNNYQRYYSSSPSHPHPHQHSTTFEATFGSDDISAEELFNMFFGTFPSQRPRRRTAFESAHQRPSPHEQHQQPSLAFGLILVLILISMLSSFFTSDPLYNLVQSSKYPVRRETQHLSVPYYVKENFQSDYQGSLGRLENSVEEDFIYTMKQNCYRERSYREAMMARARSFGSRAQFAQAQGLKMPSCDNLSKIGITRYSLY